jgi:insertion element IS1 protein InsB
MKNWRLSRLEAINAHQLSIGKINTQKIERKHLTLRTRIKRLARKTICFSKSEKIHDIVLGLFINKYEFGLAIWIQQILDTTFLVQYENSLT